jgi:hypothetical protein
MVDLIKNSRILVYDTRELLAENQFHKNMSIVYTPRGICYG